MSRRNKVIVVKRKDRKFFALKWWDHEQGRWREKSSGEIHKSKATRKAAKLEAEIEEGTLISTNIRWRAFRSRYEQEKVRRMSQGSRDSWKTAANHFEDIAKPIRLEDVTASMISRFEAGLYAKDLSDYSVACYLRSLRAAFNWAWKMELLKKVPSISMPRLIRGRSAGMRSRGITTEEFERILAKCKTERPTDWRAFQRFLKGLWFSGLRIGELLQLSWEPGSAVYMDCDHQIPMIRLLGEAQKKRRRDEYQVIKREFWALICDDLQKGYVFKLPGTKGQMTKKRVGRIISDIGRLAGVVTDPEKGKCASSHDIGRRALTTRLSDHLSQADLQRVMRHDSSDTTMRYYYHKEAQSLAARVWGMELEDDLQEEPENEFS